MPTPAKFDIHNPDSVRAFLLQRSVVDENGCWFWQGATSSTGYGNVYQKTDGKKKWFTTHRLAYERLVGPVPVGLDLDHKCRNRACCNPDHLEPVTRRTNLLRGQTIPAANARKTCCPLGHEYTEENTIWCGNSRHCRICTVRRRKEYQQSKRALLATLHTPNPTVTAPMRVQQPAKAG